MPLETPFHFLLGPLCPEITVNKNTYTSPLSSLTCLGSYSQDPKVHPFFASYHTMGSRLPAESIPESISPQGLEINLKSAFSMQKVMKQALKQHPVDVLIWWGLENGLPPDLAQIKQPKVLVVSDWHFHYLSLLPLLSDFDLILCDEKLRLKLTQLKLSTKVIYWPAYSFAPELIPAASSTRDIDVLFVGNLNPHKYIVRNQYLMRLAQLKQVYTVIRSDLPHAVYLKLLQRSKMAFNHSLRQEMNLRAYEASACGAMLLIEADNLEVDYFLEKDRAYVAYNHDNFEEQILYYLNHSQEREQIALRGQASIQKHTYSNQFAHLIQLVSEFLSDPQSALRLPKSEPNDGLTLKLAQAALRLTTDVPVLRSSCLIYLDQLYRETSDPAQHVQILNALLVAHNDLAYFPANNTPTHAKQISQRLIQKMHGLSDEKISSLLYYNLAWHFFFEKNLQACGYWLEKFQTYKQQWQVYDALFLLPLRYTGLHLNYQQAAYQNKQTLQKIIDAGSLFLLGYVLLSQEEFTQAKRVFSLCIERAPQSAEAYFEIAQIHVDMKQINLAQSFLNQGLEQGVFYPGAWKKLCDLSETATKEGKQQLQSILLRLFQDEKHTAFQAYLKQYFADTG